MAEKEIHGYFKKKENLFVSNNTDPPYDIMEWFKANNDHPKAVPHHERIGGRYDCDLLADEWMKWNLPLPALANPIGMSSAGYGNATSQAENVHLFKSGAASVYFTAVSPSKTTDRVRVVITEKCPVLIPIYWVATSKVENPSLTTKEDFMRLIMNDLTGIREVTATFDDERIYGCAVIRNKPLHIPNIPKDNVLGLPSDRLKKEDYAIDLYHGGLWLLLKAKNFTSGDHRVNFKANSVNYDIEGVIEISALV